MKIELDMRLLKETAPVYEDPEGNQVLLRSEARWPWCIVVPATDHAEFHELSDDSRTRLSALLASVAKSVAQFPEVSKVNLASFGNIVRQQHWHIIGRWPGDPLWPDSVIGAPRVPTSEPLTALRIEHLRSQLSASEAAAKLLR